VIVPVALGLADGDGRGQLEAAEEVLEIDGVLSSGVDAHVEVSLGMLSVQLMESVLQGLIAGADLGHGEGLGGLLPIGSEERDTMAVARGIDTDADAVEGRGGGHGKPPGRGDGGTPGATGVAGGVSLLRRSWARRSL
jgi:hypothetical protein